MKESSIKKIVLLLLSIGGFGLFSIPLILLIKKTRLQNKKILKVFSNIIAIVLKNKDNQLLDELLNLILTIPIVNSVSVYTEHKTFSKSKKHLFIIEKDRRSMSEVLYDANKQIGTLEIDFDNSSPSFNIKRLIS